MKIDHLEDITDSVKRYIFRFKHTTAITEYAWYVRIGGFIKHSIMWEVTSNEDSRNKRQKRRRNRIRDRK